MFSEYSFITVLCKYTKIRFDRISKFLNYEPARASLEKTFADRQ